MWSDLKFHQGLPWLPPPAGLAGPGSRLTFEGDGYGVGANAGVTWKLNDAHRLAVSYRSPVSVEYEGDFTMAPLPPAGALPPGITGSSAFETEVDFPSIVGLGYGVQVTHAWRVEANVEWIEHSRNDSLGLDIGSNNGLLMAAAGTTSIPQRWDDTWTVGAGTDWAVSPAVTLRAGWFYLPSPVPEETLMPSLTEGDTHVVSVGAGLRRGRHALDAAYVYNISEDRTVDDLRNPVAGEYEYNQQIVAGTYTFTF
jgi:long-chain fatty acid transport protein